MAPNILEAFKVFIVKKKNIYGIVYAAAWNLMQFHVEFMLELRQ